MNTTSPSADATLVPPGLAGRFVTPADSDFKRLGTIVYGGIDATPGGIVRAANVDDVVRTVNHARAHGVELAIRSGGHSNAGHSTSNGGLVLDVRDLNGIELDVGRRTAWVGAGATAIQLLEALAPHRLVVGFGDTGTVGVSGITLGGGVGYLTRKLGLTIDAVLAFELVTAAGDLITADAEHHPDLFWALRGGGGNFGVVTRIRYRLNPLEHFTGGLLILPATAETVAAFVAAADAAPDELSTIAHVMPAPPLPFLPPDLVGKLIIFGMLAFLGPDEAAQQALAPFRAIAKPLADFVQPGDYHKAMFPEMPGAEDYHPLAVSLNLFMHHVGPAEGATIMRHLEQSTAPVRVAQLRVMGGAASRVAPDATAYAHRNSRIMVNVAAFYDGSAEDKARQQRWIDEFAASLDQGDSGAYVNFIGDEGPARVRAAYPDATWARLRQVKRQYDPHNLFRRNHNIPPA
ncbi:MAG: FAD-binding oxidoreductase [Devosia sp.]